jgi:uncharacterized protein (DUF433 family)
VMPAIKDDIRTSSPIATRTEVARLLAVRPSRMSGWTVQSSKRPPLVHTASGGYGRLTIPLVGIAEASALTALLQGGMSFPEVRRAVDFIRREEGEEFALASPRLLTDGTEAFLQDSEGLRRLRDRQGAFVEVLRAHLQPLVIGSDGFVEAFCIERFASGQVTIDPRYNAGQMSFTRNRVPLFAVAGALRAGERPNDAAKDFGLSEEEVAEVARNVEWLAHFQ